MSQKEIFLKKEADNWYSRNRDSQNTQDIENDMILERLKTLKICPESVLEIGCGPDGDRSRKMCICRK